MCEIIVKRKDGRMEGWKDVRSQRAEDRGQRMEGRKEGRVKWRCELVEIVGECYKKEGNNYE